VALARARICETCAASPRPARSEPRQRADVAGAPAAARQVAKRSAVARRPRACEWRAAPSRAAVPCARCTHGGGAALRQATAHASRSAAAGGAARPPRAHRSNRAARTSRAAVAPSSTTSHRRSSPQHPHHPYPPPTHPTLHVSGSIVCTARASADPRPTAWPPSPLPPPARLPRRRPARRPPRPPRRPRRRARLPSPPATRRSATRSARRRTAPTSTASSSRSTPTRASATRPWPVSAARGATGRSTGKAVEWMGLASAAQRLTRCPLSSPQLVRAGHL
jgi:hypothetical protein